ncbi:FadR/GntR family transcriptional regulator [Rothia nasisuis]|uniref:FadR/GntR family transcriptional regulator n=1 Tax=Rothia nasisuis TaxID=2109647 RepID=UPI001F3378CC|nr:FCD domain-containing protein [Rothia nasisuis]
MKEKEPTYTALLTSIEYRLRHGQLRVGDRLPGERSLAEKYGISRASVREALRILSAVGLIRSGVGSGPKAGAVVVSEPSDALGWALRMHIATRTLPVADIVNTRVLLEGEAAARAAGVASDPERTASLTNALRYLDEMDRADISDDRFHFCDTRFHYEISSLSGNIVMDTVIDSLHLATVSYVQEAVPYLEDWAATKRELQEQHRAIYAAVLAGDPERARRTVAEHIRWFYALSEIGAAHYEYHQKVRGSEEGRGT